MFEDICQINFDAKLLPTLGGFGSVNRLAVVAVQEDCNQILAIAKTENGTGEVEARAVAGALDEWKLSDKVVASGFDTTSSNTGVHKGGGVCNPSGTPGPANPLVAVPTSHPRATTTRSLPRGVWRQEISYSRPLQNP